MTTNDPKERCAVTCGARQQDEMHTCRNRDRYCERHDCQCHDYKPADPRHAPAPDLDAVQREIEEAYAEAISANDFHEQTTSILTKHFGGEE